MVGVVCFVVFCGAFPVSYGVEVYFSESWVSGFLCDSSSLKEKDVFFVSYFSSSEEGFGLFLIGFEASLLALWRG